MDTGVVFRGVFCVLVWGVNLAVGFELVGGDGCGGRGLGFYRFLWFGFC